MNTPRPATNVTGIFRGRAATASAGGQPEHRMGTKRAGEVIIVGTAQTLQLGKAGANVAERFEALLGELCDRHQVGSIAEEMNPQAMEEGGVTSSLGMKVAAGRGLPHQHCDPDREERKAMGIREDIDILLEGFYTSRPEADSRALIAINYSKREALWIECLKDLGAWPSLFVCDASHVESFARSLGEHGISAIVASTGWPEK